MPLDATNGEYLVHTDGRVDFYETETEATEKATEQLKRFREQWDDGWPEDTETLLVAKVIRRARKDDHNKPYQTVEYVLKDMKGREGVIGDCPLCEGSGVSGTDYYGEANACHYCDNGAITKEVIERTRDALDGIVGDAMYADHEFEQMAAAFDHLKSLQGDRKSVFIKENGRKGDAPLTELMSSIEAFIAAKKSLKSMAEQPVT